MRGLRVLITNNTLEARAGSELYVRDLATGLLARGHTPIAYSGRLGAVADDLRRATVPVVSDLDDLGEPPDVIHGHHHVETMTALLRFPGVPALSYCHGWIPWEEMPPRFPRVLRYVAVDRTCRDRLVCEHGIPEERVEVVLNFVDLDRFRPRPAPLPRTPSRALVFSNYAREDGYVATVRAACEPLGIAVDVLGLTAGKVCDRPEEVLGGYDLVFAKARAAMEAMATGAAVILCDGVGAGPMVTAAEFDRLRPLNFGVRALDAPMTAGHLADQIGRYDPIDASAVMRRLRSTAGRDDAIDAIVGLYHKILLSWKAAPAPEPIAEARAAAAYLRRVSPAFQAVALCELRQESDRLRSEVDRLRPALDDAQAALLNAAPADPPPPPEEASRVDPELDRLRAELAEAERRIATAEAERDAIARAFEEAAQRRDELAAEVAALAADRDELARHRDAIASERDAALADRDAIASERDAALADRDAASRDREAVRGRIAALEAESGAARSEAEASAATIGSLEAERAALLSERASLQDDLERRRRALDDAGKRHAQLEQIRAESLVEVDRLRAEADALRRERDEASDRPGRADRPRFFRGRREAG